MDESILLSTFGQKIKFLRLQKGLSQEQLAHLANLDRTYVSSVERGKRNVSLINIYKLADALNIQVGLLFNLQSDVNINE